ncbi:MAG: hypothetical protein JWQ72_2745 [Polaromonas sp.]|nr:hypothetical protein [Polaromonas sp.]
MTLMKRPATYSAVLHARNLASATRGKAESQYLHLLEGHFGTPSKVRGAYCEYVAVVSLRVERPWDSPTSDEAQAITRWEAANQMATREVLSGLGLPEEEAFFELHVWNSRTY